MRNAVVRQRNSASQVGYVSHMRRPHDPLVENGNVHEELLERDILLGVGTDQVMEL